MRLTEIKLDAELWPRAREDKETIDRYTEIFEDLPPITIQKGTGKLVDGWHRFYAASKLGLTEVQVEEVEIADNLVFAEAVKRNLKHGIPLKREEREKAICKLYEKGFKEQQIADFVGCGRVLVWRVLKAAKAKTGNVSIETLPLHHRAAIADAPLEKQPEIAKTVTEKKLTEKETKNLVQAMTSPLLTDEDRDAMLHNPITRPYLRDEKGEKIQNLDSAMREIDTVKKLADEQAMVKFCKTVQQLDKELSHYRPEEIALGLDRLVLPVLLQATNSIGRWCDSFQFECGKLGIWEKQPEE